MIEISYYSRTKMSLGRRKKRSSVRRFLKVEKNTIDDLYYVLYEIYARKGWLSKIKINNYQTSELSCVNFIDKWTDKENVIKQLGNMVLTQC
jgi:hypothetical protein